VVDALNSKNIPKDINLSQLYKKILLLLAQLREFKIYHVLRSLNGQADKEANHGTLLRKSHLNVNGGAFHHPIP
jgi:hypothetical protein